MGSELTYHDKWSLWLECCAGSWGQGQAALTVLCPGHLRDPHIFLNCSQSCTCATFVSARMQQSSASRTRQCYAAPAMPSMARSMLSRDHCSSHCRGASCPGVLLQGSVTERHVTFVRNRVCVYLHHGLASQHGICVWSTVAPASASSEKGNVCTTRLNTGDAFSDVEQVVCEGSAGRLICACQ